MIVCGDFRAPWFAGDAWGVFEKTDRGIRLTVEAGTIRLKTLRLPFLGDVSRVYADGIALPFAFREGVLSFNAAIASELIAE